MPAHDARCPAVGKTVMSSQTSAMSTSAVRRPTPGMVITSSTMSATGRSRTSIRWWVSRIADSRKSMWASIWAISTP